MKQLAILRHAKSSWADPGVDDFDRPLNGRGRKAARQIGEAIRERGDKFDLILASPAERVRETLDGAGELGAAVKFEPSIYLASEDQLMSLLRGVAPKARSLLLVGHNPGLEQLVAAISRDDDAGFRRRVQGKFPTGALAIVDLDVKSWADVQPGCGEIVELILPRELD